MTQTEALKLALEALDGLSEPYDVLKAQEAIREALAQPEHSCVACEGNPKGNNNPCAVCGMAQPEQEPVVWMYQDKSTHEVRFQKHMRDFVDHGATYETPLYTTPPQRKPLPKGEWPKHPSGYVGDVYKGYDKSDLDNYAMQVLAAHGIKE